MNFKEFREKSLSEKIESKSGRTVNDPPHVLVLRRTGIRIFPTGEKVALYSSPKLNMTFSVPYNTTGKTTPAAMSEEVLTESKSVRIIQQLQNIVDKNEIREVKFGNNSSTRVDVTSAKYVLELHSQLTPGNQKKLAHMISQSPENFAQASAFAFKNLK